MAVKIIDNSDLVLEAFTEATARALTRCGMQAEGYAKDLCPVGTPESTGVEGYVGGTLRQSITYAVKGTPGETLKYTKEDQKNGGNPNKQAVNITEENVVYLGTNVFYAPYVELGTGKYYPGGRPDPWVYQDQNGKWHLTHGKKATPFMKPAIADHIQTYKNIIKDELKNG